MDDPELLRKLVRMRESVERGTEIGVATHEQAAGMTSKRGRATACSTAMTR